jgi:hypothetical protein
LPECSLNGYGKIHPITTSTSPFLYIDWGEDEPGMTLQRWDWNASEKISSRIRKGAQWTPFWFLLLGSTLKV